MPNYIFHIYCAIGIDMKFCIKITFIWVNYCHLLDYIAQMYE